MNTETETRLFRQMRDAIATLAKYTPDEQYEALSQLSKHIQHQSNTLELNAANRLLNALLYATR